MAAAPEDAPRLPHDEAAERAVLAAVVVDASQLDGVREIVTPEDFFDARHRRIFQALCELDDRGNGHIDLVTLGSHLQEEGLEAAGGPAYLVEIFEGTARSANAAGYARVVRERADSRRLYRMARGLAHEALREEPGPLIARTETKLLEIAERSLGAGPTPITEELGKVVEEASRERKGFPGIRTKLLDLDELMGGLRKSDLILVGARPGEGKTSLALNIALSAAEDGYSVLFFSLEMPLRQIVTRLLFSRARVDPRPLNRPGRMSERDIESLRRTVRDFDRMKIHVDDSDVSPVDLRSRARQLKREEHGLDLVIVDYIQLMRATEKGERRRDNRNLEIGDISRALKLLAKELDVPVLALSQLSRAPETREAAFAKPQLSDLRESGSLEQDADIVLLIHNPHRRKPKEGSGPDDLPEPLVPPTRQIIVAKNRNGQTGEAKLAWLGRFTRFENIQADGFEADDDQYRPDEQVAFGSDSGLEALPPLTDDGEDAGF